MLNDPTPALVLAATASAHHVYASRAVRNDVSETWLVRLDELRWLGPALLAGVRRSTESDADARARILTRALRTLDVWVSTSGDEERPS